MHLLLLLPPKQIQFSVVAVPVSDLIMGCELGKLAAGGGNPEETDSSPLEQPDQPLSTVTDPRLPLTARQKYSMVASWKGISRAMELTGVQMFIK